MEWLIAINIIWTILLSVGLFKHTLDNPEHLNFRLNPIHVRQVAEVIVKDHREIITEYLESDDWRSFKMRRVSDFDYNINQIINQKVSALLKSGDFTDKVVKSLNDKQVK